MRSRGYTIIGYLPTKLGLPVAKRKLRARRRSKRQRPKTPRR